MSQQKKDQEQLSSYYSAKDAETAEHNRVVEQMIRYRDTVRTKLEDIQRECTEKDRLKGELSKKL